MGAFAATNKAPGVYIEEMHRRGPIAGVGTSTAAFVGAGAARPDRHAGAAGELDRVRRRLRRRPTTSGPISRTPQLLRHAGRRRASSTNGGADCWFVRIGTARRASLDARRPQRRRRTRRSSSRPSRKASRATTSRSRSRRRRSQRTQATTLATTLSNAVTANVNQADVPAVDAANLRVGDWVVDRRRRRTRDRVRITSITGGDARVRVRDRERLRRRLARCASPTSTSGSARSASTHVTGFEPGIRRHDHPGRDHRGQRRGVRGPSRRAPRAGPRAHADATTCPPAAPTRWTSSRRSSRS